MKTPFENFQSHTSPQSHFHSTSEQQAIVSQPYSAYTRSSSPACPQPSASASLSPKCCVRPPLPPPHPHQTNFPRLSNHRHLDPPLRSLLPPPHQPHRLPPPHHKNLPRRPPLPPIPLPPTLLPLLPTPLLLPRPPLPRHPRPVQFPRNRTPSLHLRPSRGTQRRQPQSSELGHGGAVGV